MAVIFSSFSKRIGLPRGAKSGFSDEDMRRSL
jgi:hypothetical protein